MFWIADVIGMLESDRELLNQILVRELLKRGIQQIRVSREQIEDGIRMDPPVRLRWTWSDNLNGYILILGQPSSPASQEYADYEIVVDEPRPDQVGRGSRPLPDRSPPALGPGPGPEGPTE